jgi:hypothetical protein
MLKLKKIGLHGTWLGKYSYELSIVTLGVLISLFISGKISERNEKKDLKLQLLAVQSELEDNLKAVNELIVFYSLVDSAKEIFIKNEELTERQWSVLVQNKSFLYKKDALDMLKNTGYMRLIQDRKQLLDILECYSLLELAKEDNDYFGKLRISVILDLNSLNNFQLIPERIKNFTLMVSGFDENFLKAKEQIGNVLALYNF